MECMASGALDQQVRLVEGGYVIPWKGPEGYRHATFLPGGERNGTGRRGRSDTIRSIGLANAGRPVIERVSFAVSDNGSRRSSFPSWCHDFERGRVMLQPSRDMGKRKPNRGRKNATPREAMKANTSHSAGQDASSAAGHPSTGEQPSAERTTSVIETVVETVDAAGIVHRAPAIAGSTELTQAIEQPTEGADSYASRDPRQTVANILESLSGNTAHGVADVSAARSHRDLIGLRVNNFEIIGLLSSGGMGDVFEAIHLVIQRKVAIKVLRPEHCGNPTLVQRFFNEARAANSIKHPNIVEILDVGILPDGLPYIAMERLEGETLAQRLSRVGKLDIEKAVDFAVQAALALQAAHKRGIVHRDLKPDNLFIITDPRVAGRELVKVLDFGIAKLHGDKLSQVKTNVGSILGTPPYMSPEQCRGIPDAVDHRSDVYAMGVILFEMLCGAPPFVAEGVGEVMVMHLSSPPPRPTWRRQDIPLRIEQTILWAMEKNPDQRIPSMGDFIFTLGSGPTPVPYIVTPTGLTTAELPSPTYTPTGGVPRLRESVISLEGEFPSEDAASTNRRKASSAPGGRTAGTKPSHSARGGATGHASAAIPPGSRWSWRSGIAGASVVGLVVVSVVGFNRVTGQPNVGTASRGVEVQRPSTELEVQAQGGRPIEVTTAALRTETSLPSPLPSPMPSSAEPAASAVTSTGLEVAKPSHHTARAWWAARAAAGVQKASVPELQAGAAVSGEHDPNTSEVNGENVAPSASAEPRLEMSDVNPPTDAVVPVVGETVVEPSLPPMGMLNFDSAPWARVSVDGRVLGVTPLRGVHLPAGTHQLRLDNSELGTSTTFVVEIKAGQSVSRFVGWEQRP